MAQPPPFAERIEFFGALDGSDADGDLRGPDGALELPNLVGPFWRSVEIGRETRRDVAAGRVVAIVDSGFDPDDPVLRRHIGPDAAGAVGPASVHGTNVARLTLFVAPHASLRLLPTADPATGKPSFARISEALAGLWQDRPDIVNLSLGVSMSLAESAEYHDSPAVAYDPTAAASSGSKCTFCRWADGMSDTTIVTSAVGNARRTDPNSVGNMTFDVFCPARSHAAIACGFQRVRELEPGVLVGSSPADYIQGTLSAMNLLEIIGLTGSSFAAPLVAGALAMVDDLSALPTYLDVMVRSSRSSETLALALASPPGPERAAALAGYLDDALSLWRAFPHKHSSPVACFECSLFLYETLVNAGQAQIHLGQFTEAKETLEYAVAVMPWSASAAANLGFVYRVFATETSQLSYLLMAYERYVQACDLAEAAAIQPSTTQDFEHARDQVADHLANLGVEVAPPR